MKEILLINGEKVLVDNSDYDKLIGPRWFCSNRKGLLYARRNVKGKANTKILMHREIMGIEDPKIHIDHIDGNGLNNQRENLRVCLVSQNMANRRRNKKGSSIYKGVSKTINRWKVQICGKNIGSYEDEKEAALAYNVAASFQFREFAKLNKIEV